jgi:hypothetical protein
MTHRIDQRSAGRGVTTLDVQGVVDTAAVEQLRVAVGGVKANGGTARIVLRSGVEVDRACLAELSRLDAGLVAESPYLARWIADSAAR